MHFIRQRLSKLKKIYIIKKYYGSFNNNTTGYNKKFTLYKPIFFTLIINMVGFP